jgi:hypothetical protein
MKKSTIRRTAALAVLALTAYAVPGFAAMVIQNVVSGTVTSVGSGQIVINGTTYNVQLQGPALQELQQVHAGEVVDVALSGPPGAAGTQVVAIHVHNAP